MSVRGNGASSLSCIYLGGPPISAQAEERGPPGRGPRGGQAHSDDGLVKSARRR